LSALRFPLINFSILILNSNDNGTFNFASKWVTANIQSIAIATSNYKNINILLNIFQGLFRVCRNKNSFQKRLVDLFFTTNHA
jgi:hypothetical protein